MNTSFTHSAIIEFTYGINSIDPLHVLADRLTYLLDQTGLGYYDGHELAMDDSHGRLFLYGRNAEQLYKLIEPILFEVDWLDGALVILRFGQEDDHLVKKIEFVLQSDPD